MGKPGRYWHSLDHNRLECQLCPRNCQLHDGSRGFCFIRQNIGGTLFLTSYGRSSGFCIDPIEKKPLYHFLPGSSVLSFGTAGCNLGCKFCQNWEISKARDMERLADWASPEQIACAAKEHHCASVAFTYNDPVIFIEYALDVAAACRDLGLRTVAVTAGYIQGQARTDFFAGMDATNIDLKAFDEHFYHSLTGGQLQPVLDTLLYVHQQTKVHLEITVLLIPGLNDGEEQIRQLCRWVAGELAPNVPLHFSAFHPDFRLRHYPATPATTLLQARSIAHDAGLQYVYVGNIIHRQATSTYCPGCRLLLVEREGYAIGSYRLDEQGICPACGVPIHGIWNCEPAKGQGRRLRLTLPPQP
jgi:pyruvate formate lyase activating enzyme